MIDKYSDEISTLCSMLDINRFAADSLLSKTGGNIERAVQMHFQGWSSSPVRSNDHNNNKSKKNKSPTAGKPSTMKAKKSKKGTSSSYSSVFTTNTSSLNKGEDKKDKDTSLMIDLSGTNNDEEDNAEKIDLGKSQGTDSIHPLSPQAAPSLPSTKPSLSTNNYINSITLNINDDLANNNGCTNHSGDSKTNVNIDLSIPVEEFEPKVECTYSDTYAFLAETFDKVSGTRSRLLKNTILVNFFRQLLLT